MSPHYDPKLESDSNRRPITPGSGSQPAGIGVGAAEAVNPTVEEAYWSANYLTRDYVIRNRPYTDYQSAYRYGWESRARLGARPFRDVESSLERGWDKAKGESKLAWEQARHAVGDAWQRIRRP
jgi:hypothetical protein